VIRLLLVLVALVVAAAASAETLLTKAKIAEITERGFILSVGTEVIPVVDETATRFWRSRQPATKEDFKVGDLVGVRLKTDATPTLVREMADGATWDWLLKVRKEVLPAEVVKVDLKSIVLKVEGVEFSFRYSDKSEITVAKKKTSAVELEKGQKLFVKGRLLPTLDTWLVSASDVAPAPVVAKASAKKPALPPLNIGNSGTIKGVVHMHQPHLRMFDLVIQERIVHFAYTPATAFFVDGKKSTASAVERGLTAQVVYKRDQFGRLIVSKVELLIARPR
jgi:hypothetical protein